MKVNNFVEISKMKSCNNILSNVKSGANDAKNLNSREWKKTIQQESGRKKNYKQIEFLSLLAAYFLNFYTHFYFKEHLKKYQKQIDVIRLERKRNVK